MTISKELFLAILSMDAYNRGYRAGVAGLGMDDSKVGNATIIKDAQDPSGVAQAADFYALAYSWNGKTIISYRGTDNLNPATAGDIWNGWVIGAGYSPATQVGLAVEFYKSVTGKSSVYERDPSVIVTGRSHGISAGGCLPEQQRAGARA